MSNNKQSSVKWLARKLKDFPHIKHSYQFKELVKQAKAMHEDEIKQAIMFGDCRGKISTYATSEEYYNETFGGNNEQR